MCVQMWLLLKAILVTASPESKVNMKVSEVLYLHVH